MAVSSRTELGRKIKDFVTSQLANLTDRRQVTGYGDDGLIETRSFDPAAASGDPVPLAQLRHVRATPGDDVVTLKMGGKDLIIGALGDAIEETTVISGSGGLQMIPIMSPSSGKWKLEDYTQWWKINTVEVELPPGTWQFDLMYQGRMRRSVNSGYVGLAIEFVGDYRYTYGVGRDEWDATVNDMTKYQNVAISCRHTIQGGQTVTIWGDMAGWETAGTTYLDMAILSGTAIRVE